jgi:hypothetical protein
VSTLSVTSKKRSVLSRRIFQIEQVLVAVAFVVYALLVSINQPASLWVIMVATLTVGNLVVPLSLEGRRLYVGRPLPWNWVVFFPIQIIFGVICAVNSILFLQFTNIDREPFWLLFSKIGYFCIVVVVIANVLAYGVEELQQKLKQRNQQLEQTVEKGTIALQLQEEELKRAREIQEMLLPSTLPQLAGIQIAGAWQPAREVGGDYFDAIQLDKDRLGIASGGVYQTEQVLVCKHRFGKVCNFLLRGARRRLAHPHLRERRTLTRTSVAEQRHNRNFVRRRSSAGCAAGLDLPGLHRATATGRPTAALN